MSNYVDIGTRIDLEDLIESRMLIQANSGGGKSGIARVMMEEFTGKIPFMVIDKKGEYYTLKEHNPDIIVIGGPNGDIPTSMQAAKVLAKHIVSNGLTVVIDLVDFQSNNQRALFIKDFISGLMNLPQSLWTPYPIFIEEAHVWCGQQDTMVSGDAIKELMSEGRKMGFCGILMTQRISKLHKDAAAECNNKFIGRTFMDIDMKRSGDELGLLGQDRLKLRELKSRHFWAFGTSIQPHHVHEVVIKEAKTKFPKGGSSILLKSKKPTEKIKQAIAKLNELPAEIVKQAQVSVDKDKEIQRLKVELNAAQRGKADPAEVEAYKNQIVILNKQVTELGNQLNFSYSSINTLKEGLNNIVASEERHFNSIKATVTNMIQLFGPGVQRPSEITTTFIAHAAAVEILMNVIMKYQ